MLIRRSTSSSISPSPYMHELRPLQAALTTDRLPIGHLIRTRMSSLAEWNGDVHSSSDSNGGVRSDREEYQPRLTELWGLQ